MQHLTLTRKAALRLTSAQNLRQGWTQQRSASVVAHAEAQKINPSIKKDVDKVVDTVKVEELPKRAAFCRCWRSNKFPYCDGSHAKHNRETGDNVGPLIVENSAK